MCTNTMCSSSLSLSLSLVGSVKCVTSTTCPGQRWVCPPRLWSSSTSSEKCRRTLPLSTQNPPSLYTAGQHTQYSSLYAAGQHTQYPALYTAGQHTQYHLAHTIPVVHTAGVSSILICSTTHLTHNTQSAH